MKRLLILLSPFLIVPFFINTSPILGQEEAMAPPPQETLEAVVTQIIEEKQVETGDGNKQLYQKLELLVGKGCLKRETIIVENGGGTITQVSVPEYRVGDKLVVLYSKDFEGNDLFYITDYVRRGSLGALFFIFVILAVLIGKWRGLASIFGMLISFLVIFKFILPKVSGGSDPVIITILGSLFIIPITFYLSHGVNKKTTIALIGTIDFLNRS